MPRELGEQVPISIGTALAIEDTIIVDDPIVSALVVNLKTMYRNFMGSYPTAERPRIQDVLDEWVHELGTLKALVEQTNILFYYYYADHTGLKERMPLANFPERKSDKQVDYDYGERVAIKAVVDNPYLDVKRAITRLPGLEKRTGMISHQPIDLLSHLEYLELVLIESHTGVFKPRDLWGGKIGTIYSPMPVNVLTLQVFGDKGKMFRMQSKAQREALESIAIANKWTAYTSFAKITADIDKDDGPFRATWNTMLKTVLS